MTEIEDADTHAIAWLLREASLRGMIWGGRWANNPCTFRHSR